MNSDEREFIVGTPLLFAFALIVLIGAYTVWYKYHWNKQLILKEGESELEFKRRKQFNSTLSALGTVLVLVIVIWGFVEYYKKKRFTIGTNL